MSSDATVHGPAPSSTTIDQQTLTKWGGAGLTIAGLYAVVRFFGESDIVKTALGFLASGLGMFLFFGGATQMRQGITKALGFDDGTAPVAEQTRVAEMPMRDHIPQAFTRARTVAAPLGDVRLEAVQDIRLSTGRQSPHTGGTHLLG